MITFKTNLRPKFVWSVASLLVLAATAARASEPTAFELINEGNRYVGEQSKDKVMQIRSEKSVGTLTPNIWTITYYDPTASMKGTDVKFGAGKMLDVKRPFRLLERAGGSIALDRDKLKVDSDRALKTALAEPILKDLKIVASQLRLERVTEGGIGAGGVGEGVWKVKLWAAKLRNPNHDADIGEIWITANDGKIIKTDFHINRVD
jgi:hypothetical protein